MEHEIVKNYKPRMSKETETAEEREIMDSIHEVRFYSVECFKKGFWLGFELAKDKDINE